MSNTTSAIPAGVGVCLVVHPIRPLKVGTKACQNDLIRQCGGEVENQRSPSSNKGVPSRHKSAITSVGPGSCHSYTLVQDQ